MSVFSSRQLLMLSLLVSAGALSACNLPRAIPQASPTVEAINVPTDTPAPTEETPATPSLTPSQTVALVPQPQLAPDTPTHTPGTPTETITFTPSPGPYEHTIAQGETLLGIVSRYGYQELSIMDEVVRINGNIPSADRLPGPGAVILIPRPSPTPTIEGAELTLTAGGTLAVDFPQFEATLQHEVRDGETIIGIAGQYETTLQVLDLLNPELLFLNCDLATPSGGPGCSVNLVVGQLVNVPAPTPTPTLSPTPDGSETPTPTPTYMVPLMVFPPEGGLAPAVSIDLQWTSSGILDNTQVYLIQVKDMMTGAEHLFVTRNTSYRLDEALIPTSGETHEIAWHVAVGSATGDGEYYQFIGDTSEADEWRTFNWESR